MTPPTTRSRRLLTGSLVLLALAWTVTPAGPRPPLYDGVGFPDQPYRYVNPPAGGTATPPPTSAVDTEPTSDDRPDLVPASQETGPQVQAVISAGSLVLPGKATQVTARFQPLAPTPPLPTDGTIWGNVYQLTLTSPQGTVGLKLTANRSSNLQLRAPTADQPPPVIEVYLLGSWHRLHTMRAGNDIYRAGLISTGRYALVRLTHPDPATGADASGTPNDPGAVLWPALFIVLGALLVVVTAVLAIRRTRRAASRRPPSAATD
jgi:hypothetical protein